MAIEQLSRGRQIQRDLIAGLVVFLVALPLCLGIAKASGEGVPAFAGLLAGIVGGLVVGAISGSSTSVSGPAAGLTAVVAGQIAMLGSFEAFLAAVVVAGVFQFVLGVVRGGAIAAFFPNAVIRGLLAAIGVILILKQLPHLVGHDVDPEGEMSFVQPNERTTFSELYALWEDIHIGAAVIGVSCFALLLVWDRIKALKNTIVPAALVVVVLGTVAAQLFKMVGGEWVIGVSHSVQVPVAASFGDFIGQLQHPDFATFTNPLVYQAGFVIAVVASLETLLNLEAVDKLDPEKRHSPPNRELVAQGCGNMVSGLIGGLPVTSVIVRSSVNVQMRVRTKLSTLFHGGLLLSTTALLPWVLNEIPLSCLAAILLHTGLKLASPQLFTRMWKAGLTQFLPFVITIVAIVRTDLLVGVVIGLVVSFGFILWGNLRLPVRRIREKHLSGEVLRITLPSQVTFLNKAAVSRALYEVEKGGRVLIDASGTRYIDPDVASLIREFRDEAAPARGVQVSLIGFEDHYELDNGVQFVDYSSRDLQRDVTPEQVIQLLDEGNRRFREGERLARDLGRQQSATAGGQFPFAAVIGCIDSRAPTELIFDLGLGEVFVVRIAGNIVRDKTLGSIEYACAVAGAKVCVVLGHTRCGAVNESITLAKEGKSALEATGLEHLDAIVDAVQESIDPDELERIVDSDEAREEFAETVVRRNVERQIKRIREQSTTLGRLEKSGEILITGAIYDVKTGRVEWIENAVSGLAQKA